MDGILKLLKLIALGLLVVVLGGAAINTFKFAQMAKVAQQRGQAKHQEFMDRLPEDLRKELERDRAETIARIRNPDLTTKNVACEKIRAKQPRQPHRSSPQSIKEQYARSIVRWRKNRNRICDRN